MIGLRAGKPSYAGRVRELKNIPSLPLRGESESNGIKVIECGNLRRDRFTGHLMASPLPGANGKIEELPLLTWNEAGGRIALIRRGNRLRVEYLDREEWGYDAGGVTGNTRCAVMLRDGAAAVMTDAGRFDLLRDAEGKWAVRGSLSFPTLQFMAADEQRLSVDVDACDLSESYTVHSTALSVADAERLGSDLLKGYKELADRATRGGLQMQPLLARYRLEGADGEILYRSPTVAVTASTGVQCAGELRSEMENEARRGAIRIAADVYRLKLRQLSSSAQSAAAVHKLVVETSLPVHPIDNNVMAATAIGRNGTSGILLRCFIPGASVTMVSSRRSVMQTLYGMARRSDEVMIDSYELLNPFASGSSLDIEIPVNRGAAHGVDEEIALVRKQLSAAPATVGKRMAQCRIPNMFTAGAGCVSGGNVVWGNIATKSAAGYKVEEMAVETTPAGEAHSWRCQVVTVLASGERCAVTSWGNEFAPLKLSPVLCYPGPDAVKMSILLERDGVLYSGEFGLTPDKTGVATYYFNTDLQPIELEEAEGSFGYSVDTREWHKYPSLTAVAPASNPYELLSAATAGNGEIVAMAGMDRRGSAWEFGDHRVYAMTSEGIYLAALNDSGKKLRCSRIDRRGVTAADAVSETDDDRYPVVCIASGELLGLTRGNVSTLEQDVDDCRLCWDSKGKELWMATSEGTARVKDRLDGGWRDVQGLAVSGFYDTGSGMLLLAGGTVYDTAKEGDAAPEFSYRVQYRRKAVPGYLTEGREAIVAVELMSEGVEGTLSASSLTMNGEVLEQSELHFAGAVNSPLVVPLCCHHAPLTSINLTGTGKITLTEIYI